MGTDATCSAMLYDNFMKLDTQTPAIHIINQLKNNVSRCKISIPMRANATVGINSGLDAGIKSGKFYKK